MGLTISKLFDAFYGSTPKKILLLGLDAAGKTTILYKMNLGETVHTIPTVGFNVETIKYKNIDLNCWDIGGQKKIRSLWHHYYEGADAIIFCVDANDPGRMQEVQEELYALLDNDRLKNASLLIYANKQDLLYPLLRWSRSSSSHRAKGIDTGMFKALWQHLAKDYMKD